MFSYKLLVNFHLSLIKIKQIRQWVGFHFLKLSLYSLIHQKTDGSTNTKASSSYTDHTPTYYQSNPKTPLAYGTSQTLFPMGSALSPETYTPCTPDSSPVFAAC